MLIGAVNSLLSRQMAIDYSPIRPVGRDAAAPQEVQPEKQKPRPTVASAPHLFDSLAPMPKAFAPLERPTLHIKREPLHTFEAKSLHKLISAERHNPRRLADFPALLQKMHS